MSDWYITEKRPPVMGGKIMIPEAKRKLGALMQHYGVDYDSDRIDWQPVRCPFHDDSHASASLNLMQLRFRCHSCEAGGDAIDVVMENESMQLAEAVQWLLSL